MALANVAWILASQGKRVLVMDWDSEAPGLHRYFYPFLVDQDLLSSEGIIDFVIKFATAAATPDVESSTQANEPFVRSPNLEEGKEPQASWYKPYANILRYASSLSWPFKQPGTLDFIPAGRQGETYSTRVNSFNWQTFYEKLGGGELLELAKQRMRAEYDFILIDSRTGVSDTSGICTVQMPDVLAVCFTLNNQSIEGASAVAASVDAQRHDESGKREVRVFPIPTRVEKFEKIKLELAREAARSKFRHFLWHIPADQRDAYWGEIETFYEPFYAYEEILATFGDKPLGTNSMLASAERLTSYLTEGSVRQLDPPADSDRAHVLSQYARKKAIDREPENVKGRAMFISYRQDDSSAWARLLSSRLSAYFPNNQFFVDVDIEPGVDFVEAIEASVSSCDVLVSIIGNRWLISSDEEGRRRLDNPDDFVRLEIATALKRNIRVIPVLVDGALMPRSSELPDDLKPMVRRNALEVSHARFNADSERVIATIERIFEKADAEQRQRNEKEPAEADKLGIEVPDTKQLEQSRSAILDLPETPPGTVSAEPRIPVEEPKKWRGNLWIWIVLLTLAVVISLVLVTQCHS